MALYTWSTTAASNATADPTINWAEGQPPSSVNDSARAMMARIFEYVLDVSGAITTAGSSTAYTVATNQVFDTLAHLDKKKICFVPHTTNGATVTLNVDGLGARPLRFGPSKELQSGVLIQGTPYMATYINADGAFYLHGIIGDPYGIPLGGMLPYVGSSAPNTAFVLPFGQAISRTTYATMFSLIGTTFGTGDGSTTFNVPDLRGRAVFGLDNMGGSAASRITVAGGNFDGTALGTAGGAQNHTLTQAEMPAHTHTTTGPHHHSGVLVTSGSGNQIGPSAGSTVSSNTGDTDITLNNTGGGGSHTIMPPAIVLPFILRVI